MTKIRTIAFLDEVTVSEVIERMLLKSLEDTENV
jgi:hypothetical protein